MPDPEPLIDGILFRQTLVLLYAAYSSFKSFLVLDWALHIAVGMDTWGGRRVTHGSVVYVYAEGTLGIKRRVNAWLAANGLEDAGDIFFLPTSVMMDDPRAVEALVDAIAGLNLSPILVVIDTVHRNMRGDENSAEDAGGFVAGCDRLRDRFKATVVAVHHSGYDGSHSRGSTAFPSDADTEIALERDGMRVTLKCKKQKDGPEFAPLALEAFPVAGSLALTAVGLASDPLKPNEVRCLTAVQASAAPMGLKLNDFEQAASRAAEQCPPRATAIGSAGLRDKHPRAVHKHRGRAASARSHGPSKSQHGPT